MDLEYNQIRIKKNNIQDQYFFYFLKKLQEFIEDHFIINNYYNQFITAYSGLSQFEEYSACQEQMKKNNNKLQMICCGTPCFRFSLNLSLRMVFKIEKLSILQNQIYKKKLYKIFNGQILETQRSKIPTPIIYVVQKIKLVSVKQNRMNQIKINNQSKLISYKKLKIDL
ncbi:unnamed protein product [Paramecium sonneborni]|uniref:Uncharacterized protein n=1 Tax=Paramecium sonneborni TaxID=65129 RepID=A0A8S1M4K9_9CILI|nr:unnamed protein product [Paramecium sonneborni]